MACQRPSTPLTSKSEIPQIPRSILPKQALFDTPYLSGPPIHQHSLHIDKIKSILQNVLPTKKRVLECIQNRERILDRLNIISKQNHHVEHDTRNKGNNIDRKKLDHIQRLICGLRDATLCVVESIDLWKYKMKVANVQINEHNSNANIGYHLDKSDHHRKLVNSKNDRIGKVRFADLSTIHDFSSSSSSYHSVCKDQELSSILKNTDKYTNVKIASHPSLSSKSRHSSKLTEISNTRLINSCFIFRWKGNDYLEKIMVDNHLLQDCHQISSILGLSFKCHRNPFLLPSCNIDDTFIKMQSILSNESRIENLNSSARHNNKTLDMRRIEAASLVIYYHELQKKGDKIGNDDNNGSERELEVKQKIPAAATSSIKTENLFPFPRPNLNRDELHDYSTMPSPPIQVAVIVACSRILLKCDETDVVGSWKHIPPITISMAIRMLRQPIQPILSKIKSFYNHSDSHASISNHVLSTLYPVVINDKLDPNHIITNISNTIGNLASWIKNIVIHEVERRTNDSISSHIAYSDNENKLELDVNFVNDIERIKKSSEEPLLFSDWQKECNSHERNKKVKKKSGRTKKRHKTENDANCLRRDDLKCIQNTTKTKQKESDNSLPDKGNSPKNNRDNIKNDAFDDDIESMMKIMKNDTIKESNDVTSSSRKSLCEMEKIPIPMPCLVYTEEGSTSIYFTRSDVLSSLTPDDSILIGNVHQSKNWVISSFGLDSNSKFKATLTEPYHNDTIEENMIEFDSQKGHKAHNCRAKRFWKLIPKENDKRQPWRIQYDNGDVPWVKQFSVSFGSSNHFHVSIAWDIIEECCRDALCNPENCVHEQRVFYFQNVSQWDIIKETYKSMCQWHPICQAIDNVKWSKLARKMKFLTNLKNTSHEVDMAFARQIRGRKERKLNLDMFTYILQDVAMLQYPWLRSQPGEALRNLLWNTVVMLPTVNFMAWTDAKEMAVVVEGKRLCAQIRIASCFRKILQRRRFLKLQNAVSSISKYYRRRIALRRKKNVLTALQYDRQMRIRYLCALICQKTWRRYNNQLNLLEYKREKRSRAIHQMKDYQLQMNKKRKLRKNMIVYKRIKQIQETFALIIMMLQDNRSFGKNCVLEIVIYLPRTQTTFTFNLEEKILRDCMEEALGCRGPLSWNEMLLSSSLNLLTHRLMLRFINRRPIVLLSKRTINERGRLISKRSASFSSGIFVISIFRSHDDFVLCAYNPKTCDVFRTSITVAKLFDWLQKEVCNKKRIIPQNKKTPQTKFFHTNTTMSYSKSSDHLDIKESQRLLEKENEKELTSWLMKRTNVVVDSSSSMCAKLVLEYEAEEAKMEKISSKIQSLWRSKLQVRFARKKVREQFEKAYSREEKQFYYVNKKTGIAQWEKPYLLGNDDLDPPKDEWRKEEKTGIGAEEVITFFRNLATGQTSSLSEEDAAKMMQRKFRERQSNILLDFKASLAAVANAVKFIKSTESNYAKNPQKLSYQFNFALLCYCIEFDIPKARLLFEAVYLKSPAHPVIARTYGIFILATCKPPRKKCFEIACRSFHEAEIVDPGHKMFQTAFENFFHWSVISNPTNPFAILNYALVFQCIYSDMEKTERLYRKALAEDPTNTCVQQNFELFEEERYPGGVYDSGAPSSSVLRRSENVNDDKCLRQKWGEWIRKKDPFCTKPVFQYFWYNNLTKKAQYREPDWKRK